MVITFSWYFMVLNRFSSWQLNYHRFMFPAHTHLLNFRYIYFWSHEYISLAWWIEHLWVLNMRKIASKPRNILKTAFKMILQYCTEFIWGHCAAKLLWKYETIDFYILCCWVFFCSSHVIVISHFFTPLRLKNLP